MPKQAFIKRISVNFTNEKLYAVFTSHAKKKDLSESAAGVDLIERGLSLFDRDYLSTADKISDMDCRLGEIADQFETFAANIGTLVDASDEDLRLRDQLAEIYSELHIVGRLVFKSKFPTEYAKRSTLVAQQVKLLLDVARGDFADDGEKR